jgi:cytochrome c
MAFPAADVHDGRPPNRIEGRMTRPVPLLLLLLWPALAAAEPSAERGRALAQENCARCHAVGREGDSPNPDAPAFRILGARYPVASLAEAFAEGVVTGHPGMPEFEWEPETIEALIAYLESIQARPDG